jgi:hypothetical protein
MYFGKTAQHEKEKGIYRIKIWNLFACHTDQRHKNSRCRPFSS